MKIEGTDATSFSANSSTGITVNATVSKESEVNTSTKELKTDTNDNKKIDSKKDESNLDTVNISSITPVERKELSIPDKVVIEAIEKANKAISGGNRRFEFSIHKKTKEIMIKVINSDTNEIVREIPPEKTLDMVARMWEMAGIIVDERR
jgi:flagellar protein FlaG